MNRCRRKNKLLKFIVVPISFFVIGTVILYATLLPIAKPYIEILNLFVFSEDFAFRTSKRNFDVSQLSDNIYIDPNDIDFPSQGDEYAVITIESVGLQAPVYYGDSAKELNSGVGTYLGCYLPGQGHTVLMGAHNNGYFKNLGDVNKGDIINIDTSYGKYVYTVTGIQVADKDDRSAYDLTKKEDNLILYTCYPFNTLGLTRLRYFVYSNYTSGPRMQFPT